MSKRRRNSEPKPPKRKTVNVKLAERKNAGKVTEPYRIMEDLIAKHHKHLADAKIAIAWRSGWKPDADGRLQIGQARKGSDLDRSLHGYDFVILLNREAWKEGGLSEDQKVAVVDHELCHCQVSMDANGEPKTDDLGRTVYRLRKHDIEEFTEVVARYGCYTGQLEQFAVQALDRKRRPLLDQTEQLEPAGAGQAH